MLSHTRGKEKARFYRDLLKKQDLVPFNVSFKETDLLIMADHDMTELATEITRQVRDELRSYLARDKRLMNELRPVEPLGSAPEIIKDMCRAAKAAGVGPMAAVAGAIAQKVGQGLREFSDNVIIENGGDLYVDVLQDRTIGLYAGPKSPFSMKIGIRINHTKCPMGVCTSSGTVGHSLSFGKTDASVVIADNVAMADAMATSIGNRVKNPDDIATALEWVQRVGTIKGTVILIGDKIGAWGDIEIVRL